MIPERGVDVGKAYGFFYCDASKQELETELPKFRELSKTPSDLEITLTEGMDNVQGEEKLTALAQKAKQAGMNYMMQAAYPGKTNIHAADEAAMILNHWYLSSLGDPEKRIRLVYEQDGKYVFRE